jgi:hypothetical protein
LNGIESREVVECGTGSPSVSRAETLMSVIISLGEGETALTLDYQMSIELVKSTMADQWPQIPKYVVPGTKIAYAIRPAEEAKPRRLWITGTEIFFNATITNQGAQGALDEWQMGFIQSIYGSERNGHYAGGFDRLTRLNVEHGPLKDGNDDEIYYGSPVNLAGKSSGQHNESDAPNFELPLVFGPNDSALERTSGRDEFETRLALTRERDKSIVILKTVAWNIAWDGVYLEGTTQPWTPSNPSQFFTTSVDGQVTTYLNQKGKNQRLPFSLLMKEAEEFHEMKEEGGWTGYTPKGKKVGNRVLNLGDWRNS